MGHRNISIQYLWAAILAAAIVMPLSATEIVLESNASTLGAAVSSASDAGLTTYSNTEMNGLTFTAVGTDYTGGSDWVLIPSSAPTGTEKVVVPGTVTSGNYPSGFVETTFTLPTNFTAASITGSGSVDDKGDVFLNGINIGSLTGQSDTTFTSLIEADFVSGVNTLVISDINSGAGPAGVAFYADVNYTAGPIAATTVTPEPRSMFLFGTGLLLLAGLVYSKTGLRAS